MIQAILLSIDCGNQTWQNRKTNLDKRHTDSVKLIPREQIVYIKIGESNEHS